MTSKLLKLKKQNILILPGRDIAHKKMNVVLNILQTQILNLKTVRLKNNLSYHISA